MSISCDVNTWPTEASWVCSKGLAADTSTVVETSPGFNWKSTTAFCCTSRVTPLRVSFVNPGALTETE